MLEQGLDLSYLKKESSRQKFAAATVAVRPKIFDVTSNYEGIPYDINKDDERLVYISWCRHFYNSHHLIPTLIDIFARFPIIGITHTSKEKRVTEFFEQWAEDMSLQTYLVDLGIEYWKIGWVFSLGEWSPELGKWVSENIIPQELINVETSPLTKTRMLTMKITKDMENIFTDKRRIKEKEELLKTMPEIAEFIQKRKDIPMSSDSLAQLQNGQQWEKYASSPLMARAFNQLISEQKLERAKNAVAERLASPLITVEVGYEIEGQLITPDDREMADIQYRLEEALNSDFRMVVLPKGVNIEAVDLSAGRITGFTTEFERIERNLFKVFGINPDIISGGSNTYASVAVSADFLIQRFYSWQHSIKSFLLNQRYKPMAEAQEFYDYEVKGGKNTLIEEEYLDITMDEKTGKVYREIKKRPKLLLPEIQLKNIDVRDEKVQQDFLMNLRNNGIPVSDELISARTRAFSYNFETELKKTRQEAIEKAVDEALTNKEIHERLKEEGLEAYYKGGEQKPNRPPLGIGGPPDLPDFEGGEDFPPTEKPIGESEEPNPNVPEESNEQTERMPMKQGE